MEPSDEPAVAQRRDHAETAPAEFTLETAYGSVKPISCPEDFKRITREAKEEHVERTIRKMQRESGADQP